MFIKRQMINEAIEYGPEFINRMDNEALLHPDAMKRWVWNMRSKMVKKVPIAVHIHNDYGLAAASNIASVTAGAQPDQSHQRRYSGR
jgi:isopropylmalate/homocitrate/citramalate synthase